MHFIILSHKVISDGFLKLDTLSCHLLQTLVEFDKIYFTVTIIRIDKQLLLLTLFIGFIFPFCAFLI